MLICKGSRVAFDIMPDAKGRKERHVIAPGSYGMLHDPEGKDWPRNSVLVMPFKRGGQAEKPTDNARAYMGRGYTVKQGTVNTPPKALTEWKRVGKVQTIYYSRPGTKAPGGYYHHFVKGAAIEHKLFRGGGGKHPTLYRRGKMLRLELQDGATLNERGFVWP
jgi:hypothetical protein